jgi:hypothetical protein
MKLDNLNLVFYEFFKLIEVRIMNIDDYFLNEDLYPIFVFLDFIAHDFFVHNKIIFDKEQKRFLCNLRDKSINMFKDNNSNFSDKMFKRGTQSNNESLDALKQQILKENEILINSKFDEFFDKFKEKFGNMSSQASSINENSASVSTSSSAKSVKFSNYKDDNYIENCFNKIKR